MYRFNGHDQRLERTLQCVLLLMEAFDGIGPRFAYEIYGHSGEGPEIPFVQARERGLVRGAVGLSLPVLALFWG